MPKNTIKSKLGKIAYIFIVVLCLIVILSFGRLDVFMPFILVLIILTECLWLFALVDCALNESSEGNDKIVWVIIIIFTNAIGAIIYLAARRPQRKAKLDKQY